MSGVSFETSLLSFHPHSASLTVLQMDINSFQTCLFHLLTEEKPDFKSCTLKFIELDNSLFIIFPFCIVVPIYFNQQISERERERD